MTEAIEVTLCGCPACWCIEPTPLDDPVCSACLAGIHQAQEGADGVIVRVRPKCKRHRWDLTMRPVVCIRCGLPRNEEASRRGRNSRKRGGRHELSVERTYGPRKIGPLGGPADNVGTRTKWQVKTHTGRLPAQLLGLFAALDTQRDDRAAVVLHRYLRAGQTPLDFVVVRGPEWLNLVGRDE